MDSRYYIPYTTDISVVGQNATIPAACSTIVLWNQGTQYVDINGMMRLQPGESFTFEGYPGEMNISNFDIVFQSETSQGSRLIIIRKNYSRVKPEAAP